MRLRIAAAAALLAVLAGCGEDASDDPSATPAPTTSTAVATEPATATPTPETMRLRPGAVGPVEVGMTQQQAAATGLFDVDVMTGVEGCRPVEPLAWREPWTERVDVMTSEDGTIVSMGVLGSSDLRTEAGIGIGSTLADVRAAHPQVSAPETTGFGQSGVWLQDGSDWLGFLFDEAVQDLGDDSAVIFLEVADGERPALVRSGC